jgi:hypothetical protein
LPVACALELIHTFSLIQDDLPCMDNDSKRRGKPSLHVAFGEATALLASDVLLARAFELVASSTASAPRRLRVVRELAQAIGVDGVAAGQLSDIAGKEGTSLRGVSPLSRSQESGIGGQQSALRRIHSRKTARLIAVSLKAGAIVAGSRESVLRAFERAGMWLGMLFQITDDLLDTAQDVRIFHHQDTKPALERPDEILRFAQNDGSEGTPRIPLVPLCRGGEILMKNRAGLTYPGLYGQSGARFRARRYLNLYHRELARVRAYLTPRGFRLLAQVGDFVLARSR